MLIQKRKNRKHEKTEAFLKKAVRVCEGPHKRELVKFRARGELHEDDELDAVDVEKGDGLSLDYEPLYQ